LPFARIGSAVSSDAIGQMRRLTKYTLHLHHIICAIDSPIPPCAKSMARDVVTDIIKTRVWVDTQKTQQVFWGETDISLTNQLADIRCIGIR